ncbi:Iron(III) dicitrate transport system permease [Pseudomonas brassicacearum]|nr:Iron(III) dicitrate transport system permease [Pseudomonas brassicacearum]
MLLGIALVFTFNALLALVQFFATEQAVAAVVFWTMGSLTKHRGDYRVDASPGLQGRGADRTMQPRTAPHPDRRYRLSAICIRRAQRVAHYFSYRPGPRPERMTISA